MTIRPDGDRFVLACDGRTRDGIRCTQTRPLSSLDDIAQAIRVGWRRIVTDRPMVGHWIAGHRCARCACVPLPVDETEIVPLGTRVAHRFWLLPEEARP